MCGICVSVLFSGTFPNKKEQDLDKISIELLKKRGPDHFETKSVQCKNGTCLSFCGSVLHLRGSSCISQPFYDTYGNVLLWNGEIFEGYLTEDKSDTLILANCLSKCLSPSDVLSIFENLKGPWAFIYYQKKEELLWFGRDIFGRRSLLWTFSKNDVFCLSSVAVEIENGTEVPCDGVYCLDLKSSHFEITLYPFTTSPSGSKTFAKNNLDLIKPLIIQRSSRHLHSPVYLSLNKMLPLNMIQSNLNDSATDFLQMILQQSEFSKTVLEFENVLSEAVKKRVLNQPFMCKVCFKNLNEHCCHASIGILFSGGLDSIVIAALADRYVPPHIPIDLLNVAFAKDEQSLLSYDTPDRITGKNGLQELKKLNSLRTWIFVMINVSLSELELERNKVIHKLIVPSSTVLDDSIGCALWFAAKGQGILENGTEVLPYTSPTRVLLVGMGADEQLAGYSRHRAKFNSTGWSGLLDELELELDRISSRNLGRDDRIISDHGREARFPFLDENVVSFLNATPANLNYSRGIGEKLLLRLLAFKLGLIKACTLPKRAIQFGSRIARIENTKEKGSDVCGRLKMSLSISDSRTIDET